MNKNALRRITEKKGKYNRTLVLLKNRCAENLANENYTVGLGYSTEYGQTANIRVYTFIYYSFIIYPIVLEVCIRLYRLRL